jgi:catechol 2,3-dioxygenase-like lactoylglutathione lyase family enzyme
VIGEARLGANLHTSDLDRALAFYGGKLGLELREIRELLPGHREGLLSVGGATICLEESSTVTPRTDTPVAFEVDDLDATVSRLREQGVAPEEYDLPGLKTVDGIATLGTLRVAWIADPDGNLLGLLAGG